MSPIITDRAFDIITHSQDQTRRIGQLLAKFLQPGDVVCLQGELGSGKTCLAQGIGAGLGVSATISSPTFVYINEYSAPDGGPYLYHVDLYRIEDLCDAFALGLEDYMYGDGVTVIEWAERAAELMPKNRLWITLSYVDYTKRSLYFQATGEHYVDLVTKLRSILFPRKPRPTQAGQEE